MTDATAPRLKAIKDAAISATSVPEAKLSLLGLSLLPFAVYALVELPPERSRSAMLSLRLLDETARPPTDLRREDVPLPKRAPAGLEAGAARKLLLLLSWPEAPEGRYRLGLTDGADTLAETELARRPDHLRPIPVPAAPPGPPPLPVLLSGSPKSGTTWLEKIVGAHPDALVLHEGNTLNLFDHEDLTEHLQARHEHFRFKDYIAWFDPAYGAGDVARLVQVAVARDIVTAFGRAWGARLVADRTSNYAEFYLHVLRFWPEARIVHIVRHPLDVLASRLFHEANLGRDPDFPVDLPRPFVDRLNALLESGTAVEAGGYLTDADARNPGFVALLREWHREQRRFLGSSRAAPASFHLLRYERLSQDFAGEAGGLFAFLGTDPARTDLAAIREASAFHALSGGRVPGEANPRSFYRKGVVGDWRAVFSPAQARALWAHVADTAGALGYALD